MYLYIYIYVLYIFVWYASLFRPRLRETTPLKIGARVGWRAYHPTAESGTNWWFGVAGAHPTSSTATAIIPPTGQRRQKRERGPLVVEVAATAALAVAVAEKSVSNAHRMAFWRLFGGRNQVWAK